MGSTVWLITRGPGGAVGIGYAVSFDCRHSLQQQQSRSRVMIAPPIMAPGIEKSQWLNCSDLDSNVICWSSLISVSASNFPGDPLPELLDCLCDLFIFWLLEKLPDRPGPVQPFGVDLSFFSVISGDEVIHCSNVAAWTDS